MLAQRKVYLIFALLLVPKRGAPAPTLGQMLLCWGNAHVTLLQELSRRHIRPLRRFPAPQHVPCMLLEEMGLAYSYADPSVDCNFLLKMGDGRKAIHTP